MSNKLLNKKVKLSNNNNFSIIIEKLKELKIHTGYIEDKNFIHSLFFKENETLFILSAKPTAEAEFQDADFEEIDLEVFMIILYCEDKSEAKSEDKKEDKKEVDSGKMKLSAQISYKDNEIFLKDLDIDYMYYNNNNYKLAIGYKDRKINFDFISLEFYEHIRKILLWLINF